MSIQKNNKKIITEIFSALSKGNDEPLLESMTEDMGQWCLNSSKGYTNK